MFREQVGTVSTWFDRWTPCEQTVAMVALLRRLQPTQARFITSVLHRQVADCGDLRRTEILANDSNYVASLANLESKEALIRELLSYLPLLNPKNVDVKSLYLALIPKVLKYTLDHCVQMEEARQLLSYSLIHPAFTVEDRGLFANWLHQFEEKLSSSPSHGDGLGHYPSSCNNSPPNPNGFGSSWQNQQHHSQPINTSTVTNNQNTHTGSPSQGGGLSLGNYGGSLNFHRIRRSNSLTPPVLHSEGWNSQDELCSTAKPRSLSISSELSPQSSLASSGSGSESHLDDPRPQFTAPGMQDVPSWLKSLRLHKYAYLFAYLTFEEMLDLNEEKLEINGVTKGARHKIIISVAKLRERVHHLKKVYDEMTSEKDTIRNALNEVKWTLTTPIKPASTRTGHPSGPDNAADDSRKNEVSQGNPPNNNVMAPIGTNRFQNESNNSENNRFGDGLLQQREQNPVGTRENEADSNELTVWIIRVLGKACELNPDMELEGLLVSVLERCLSHDAFTVKQKRMLTLWRQQAPSIMPSRRNSSGSHYPYPHFHSHHRNSNSPNSGNISKHSRHFSPRVLNFGNQLASGWSTGGPGNSLHAMFMAKRPSLQDSILEVMTICL